MKSMFLINSFILLILLASGCKEGSSGVESEAQSSEITYVGLDINGDYKSCKPMDESIACTEIFGENEVFAKSCEDAGDMAITCECHDYICVSGESSGEATGIDIDGNERTCEPMPIDSICTMVFTQGDQYALDCTEKGGTSFQCGCHDYICLN